jgi:serine/threonine-protein kinase
MIGSVVGAYRIVQQIGAGGMGSVWLADHTMLGRRAAIKVLHAEYSNRPEVVQRFFNEARAATAIADPGIVQIFDFGQHVDGSAYIVMELLDGETLDKRLQRLGVIPVWDALRIMRQVASSLGAAHARGIVHRDLKPDNIFLVRDPEVAGGERAKVLDFGIAKLVGDPSSKTMTSAVMGTPMYMSPEQCRGAGHVDQRSDVYSLGCVLFTLVTGRPPFDADGPGEIIAMHLREPAPRASLCMPGLPPAIDELIATCLEKDPTKRFDHGAALGAAIGALLASGTSPGPPSASFPQISPAAVNAAPTTLSGSAVGVANPPARRRGVGLAIMAGVVAVSAIVAIAVIRRGDTPPASSPPVTTAAPPVAEPAPAPPPARTAPPADDRPDRARDHIRAVLAAIKRWTATHAGAPCPRPGELDQVTANDPWGHAVAITCTDQPADQIAGVTSAGPDGAFGTEDDVASWTLGRDVTSIVRGVRWPPVASKPAAPAPPRVPRTAVKPEPPPPPAAPPPTPKPNPYDEIPTTR